MGEKKLTFDPDNQASAKQRSTVFKYREPVDLQNLMCFLQTQLFILFHLIKRETANHDMNVLFWHSPISRITKLKKTIIGNYKCVKFDDIFNVFAHFHNIFANFCNVL